MIGIYKIVSPTDKVYVGQSTNIKKRFISYKSLNNSKKQRALHNSFKKHGITNHRFEIIELCSIDLLNKKERFYQDFYDVIKKGLNSRLTKTKDKSGFLSEETKKRISKNRKGIKPIFKNPQERIDKIKKALTGKKLSKEHIESLSKAQTGLKRSPEAIAKSVKSRIGRKDSVSTKKIKSENQKGGSNSFAKVVLNTETGVFYDTAKEAAESLGWTYNRFNHYINGRTKTKIPFIKI